LPISEDLGRDWNANSTNMLLGNTADTLLASLILQRLGRLMQEQKAYYTTCEAQVPAYLLNIAVLLNITLQIRYINRLY